MDIKLSNLNHNTASIDELKQEIDRLKSIKEEYNNRQMAIKIFINSIYGAAGSPWFVGYNVNLAEAVTLQGQDLSKYASSCIDEYFLNEWHKDTELHKYLGLTYANKITGLETATIYMDTDSVSSETIVNTDNGSKTIEEWYNEQTKDGGTTEAGHESVLTSDSILNWSKVEGRYYAKVKRIIRHKVTKSKWKLTARSGNSVFITSDHSLIAFRKEEMIKIKPNEFRMDDEILCVNHSNDCYIDKVESCKEVGTFKDEYVYDVEVDDETHTFIANDILVHNSCYITFDPMIKSCDYTGDPVQFILKVNNFRLNKYIKEKFDKYAERFNTENIQKLELEKISHSATMLAKKKYILDIAWKDPGMFYKNTEQIKFVGVEIVQGSTSKFARKALTELIRFILKKGKQTNYSDIIQKLKEYKREYVLQSPEDIAKTQTLGDYEKYCLEDKKEIRLASRCPQNVRGASIYNHHVLNSKWKTKYNIIHSGDKMKFYYTKHESEIFGFLPGNYPYEFAPDVDYDMQFEKSIIEPINRVLVAIGYNAVPGNLIVAKSLF